MDIVEGQFVSHAPPLTQLRTPYLSPPRNFEEREEAADWDEEEEDGEEEDDMLKLLMQVKEGKKPEKDAGPTNLSQNKNKDRDHKITTDVQDAQQDVTEMGDNNDKNSNDREESEKNSKDKESETDKSDLEKKDPHAANEKKEKKEEDEKEDDAEAARMSELRITAATMRDKEMVAALRPRKNWLLLQHVFVLVTNSRVASQASPALVS